jgi:hypothetical protein
MEFIIENCIIFYRDGCSPRISRSSFMSTTATSSSPIPFIICYWRNGMSYSCESRMQLGQSLRSTPFEHDLDSSLHAAETLAVSFHGVVWLPVDSPRDIPDMWIASEIHLCRFLLGKEPSVPITQVQLWISKTKQKINCVAWARERTDCLTAACRRS